MAKTWQLLVAGIFLLSMLLQIWMAVGLQQRGELNTGQLTPLIVKILTLYAAPFGVMVGGVFSAKGASRRRISPSVGIAVLILVLVWNSLLVGRYALLISSPEDTIEQLSAFQDGVVPVGSFLTAAALTFLYKEPGS